LRYGLLKHPICVEEVIEKSVTGLSETKAQGRVPIARHHWSKAPLEYVKQHKTLLSSCVSRQVAQETAFSFDATAKWNNPKTGEDEYFHVPNMKRAVESQVREFYDP
jgi:hypothetical protein